MLPSIGCPGLLLIGDAGSEGHSLALRVTRLRGHGVGREG